MDDELTLKGGGGLAGAENGDLRGAHEVDRDLVLEALSYVTKTRRDATLEGWVFGHARLRQPLLDLGVTNRHEQRVVRERQGEAWSKRRLAAEIRSARPPSKQGRKRRPATLKAVCRMATAARESAAEGVDALSVGELLSVREHLRVVERWLARVTVRVGSALESHRRHRFAGETLACDSGSAGVGDIIGNHGPSAWFISNVIIDHARSAGFLRVASSGSLEEESWAVVRRT